MVVGLARGCSPIHVMLANQMGAWSDAAERKRGRLRSKFGGMFEEQVSNLTFDIWLSFLTPMISARVAYRGGAH
jgi:hypothetical protein